MTGTILGSAALTAGQVATTSAASNTVRIRSILPLFAAAEREKSLVDSSGCFRQSGQWIKWNLPWPRWEEPCWRRRGNDRWNHLADRLDPYTTSTSPKIRKTMVRLIW